ncbi:hypothetical protein WNY51_10155 [Pseudocolwellia sp. AS88]|nr:hypothetical protein [Pseudocolwellia sp. AS88]MDO7084272.1 hypothetical protein [Pseudocolwellia sp. AS88]
MEQFNNNVVSQSVTKDQMNYSMIEEQLLEANKKIEELESALEWSSRAYE